MKKYIRHLGSLIIRAIVYLAAAFTVIMLGFIIAHILIKGVPYLTPELFAFKYNSDNVSMMPSIINTLIMIVLVLVIAVPFGIFSAIYLVEYADKNNKFVNVIRLTTETLTGIPSIIYGLFGMLFFNYALHWGNSLIGGALTLAIMVLPVIMRTTEEALIAVPLSYREGSFALGAGKVRTIFKVVLPPAIPGILSGIILAIGRIVGETAALVYTAGTVPDLPKNIFSSGRTLAVHMYSLSREGMYTNQAYATAVILLLLVIIINRVSALIAKKLQK